MDRSPFAPLGIDHIVLRVAALERMLGFYCGVLGCAVERERPEVGLTQLRVGRSIIDLVTLEGALGRKGGAGPSVQGRNLDHFCLTISPYDEAALAVHLAKHDVEVVEAGLRYGAEGQGPSVYIRDPEGNVVELKCPADPALAASHAPLIGP
jgi:catechol 2,3-dioxygenase-like lactoylglutathione lyase family enzyme